MACWTFLGGLDLPHALLGYSCGEERPKFTGLTADFFLSYYFGGLINQKIDRPLENPTKGRLSLHHSVWRHQFLIRPLQIISQTPFLRVDSWLLLGRFKCLPTPHQANLHFAWAVHWITRSAMSKSKTIKHWVTCSALNSHQRYNKTQEEHSSNDISVMVFIGAGL